MAEHALGPGSTVRRRALFGLLDANGWSWASLKAFAWFILIIFVLGYLPDRAYYFTVFPTIDLGILAWSPVNMCPPENQSLPCPAPPGSSLPWQKSPDELALPSPRMDGAVVQAGSKILYIGGTDGTTAANTVFVSGVTGTGNISKWSQGPALPDARSKPAAVFLNGSVYVIGGSDASGAPSTTVYVSALDPATGGLAAWQTADQANLPLTLPAPRTAVAAVAASDGIIAVGGADANGPVDTVWKSTLEKNGKLGAWQPQGSLARPQAGGVALLVGNYLWLVGGTDASGPSGAVQRGTISAAPATLNEVVQWGIKNGLPNLPVARADPAGFVSNGVIYIVGGSDTSGPKSELYWAIPTDQGEITDWKHLPQSDLPQGGLTGSAALVGGTNAFLIGGKTTGGVISQSARTNLAPQPPFFQLGLVGATVPALKIGGEVGQQLGYLNAAGVGTVDFVLLILVGWAYAHKERTREIWNRIRRRT